MRIKDILDKINNELHEVLSLTDEKELMTLESQIKKANRIFVAGAGRSLLMIRGLAMRLMHAGYQVYVVGETITPAIEKGDMLIIASGSGNTSTLLAMAEKCRKASARLSLITTNRSSKIAELADYILEIKTSTSKSDRQDTNQTIQPGGNTFEQCVLLIGDAIVINLTVGISLEQQNRNLMKLHANLE